MSNTLRITFRRGDWLAIALVVLMIVGSTIAFLPRYNVSASSVQVYLDGKLTDEFPLDTELEIDIAADYVNTLCIRSGKASIIRSDCPGADCVHSGWISAPGRSIVCLPNRVEIRIVGTKSEVDFVVR